MKLYNYYMIYAIHSYHIPYIYVITYDNTYDKYSTA